jgi:hypothetical protein
MSNKIIRIPNKIIKDIKDYQILETEYGRIKYHQKLLDDTEKFILSKSKKSISPYLKDKIIYENKNIIERMVLSLLDSGKDINQLYKVKFTNKESVINNIFVKKAIEEYRDIIMAKHIPKHKALDIGKFTDTISKTILKAYDDYQKHLYITSQKTDLSQTDKNITEIIDKDNHIEIHYRDYIKKISHQRYYNIHNNLVNNDKITPIDFIRMILRYGLTKDSGQQWALGYNLYKYLNKILDINKEMFGSPLNFTLPYYCSLNLDTDEKMGSLGDFFELKNSKVFEKESKGAIFNPPYITSFMDEASIYLTQILEKMRKENKKYIVICFVPEWTDANYMKILKNSKYTLHDKTLLKGEYIHSKKSIGKKMLVTRIESHIYMMHSFGNKLSSEELEDLNIKFKRIVKFMKNEADQMIYQKKSRKKSRNLFYA